MTDVVLDLITSELFYCPNVRAVLDGSRMPFGANSLRAIVMTRNRVLSLPKRAGAYGLAV